MYFARIINYLAQIVELELKLSGLIETGVQLDGDARRGGGDIHFFQGRDAITHPPILVCLKSL